jgi:diguanylate cyclase (GGDEF)-like protein
MHLTILPQNGLFTGLRRLCADVVFPEGKEQRDLAERAANTDHLTGLANRRAFELAQPTAEADFDVAVILFDADNFGKVNKVLGHHVGDQLLANMAQVIKLAAARYGVQVRVFRLGGDEFAVFCPYNTAVALRDTVEKLYTPLVLPDGTLVSISGTIGDTLADADTKLQARKEQHKKCLIAARS